MKPDMQTEGGTGRDGPELAETDWDAIDTEALAPEVVPENGDLRYHDDIQGEQPEEDDDNPFQESDEALPDDEEERAIARDPGHSGTEPSRD